MANIPSEWIDHPYAIVVSQGCDVEWDYKARQEQAESDKMLGHILFCELFPREDIKVRGRLKSDQFRRIRQNQDERYQYFGEGQIADSAQVLPELVADFKAVFSLPVEFVYTLLTTGRLARLACLPSPYLEDFIHRVYSFLGRVAVPELPPEE